MALNCCCLSKSRGPNPYTPPSRLLPVSAYSVCMHANMSKCHLIFPSNLFFLLHFTLRWMILLNNLQQYPHITFSPFYPTNRSRNPLPVVSPSPQHWMTRAAFFLSGLLAWPDLSPLPSTSIHSLHCTDLSKVSTWPHYLPRQAPSSKHVRHVRPHQLHLLPSFLCLHPPPYRTALSLCRGYSFCLDPSLQCLPPLSS